MEKTDCGNTSLSYKVASCSVNWYLKEVNYGLFLVTASLVSCSNGFTPIHKLRGQTTKLNDKVRVAVDKCAAIL